MSHLALDHLDLRRDHYGHIEPYRLLWREGTRQLWVEVREPDDRVLALPVQPERALDAFNDPYGYASLPSLQPSASRLAVCDGGPRAACPEYRDQ